MIASVDEDSDTAGEISASEIGVSVAPGCAESLASAISEMKKSTGRRIGQGERARNRLEVEYAKRSVLERYERLLSLVATGELRP